MEWPKQSRIISLKKEYWNSRIIRAGETIEWDKGRKSICSAEIRIEIINDDEYEKSEDFTIELGEPIWHRDESDFKDEKVDSID